MRQYLIVDDNRAFAENLGEIVRDLGDEVTVAEDGEQFEAKIPEFVLSLPRTLH